MAIPSRILALNSSVSPEENPCREREVYSACFRSHPEEEAGGLVLSPHALLSVQRGSPLVPGSRSGDSFLMSPSLSFRVLGFELFS